MTSAWAGTSRVTTAPAATIAHAPISTPHTIVAFAPIDAPSCTMVCLYPAGPLGYFARGVRSFVNTHDGPQNTKSRSSTPSYIETLFCSVADAHIRSHVDVLTERAPLPDDGPSLNVAEMPDAGPIAYQGALVDVRTFMHERNAHLISSFFILL